MAKFRTGHFGLCNFESKKQPQKWCNVLERGLETSVSSDKIRFFSGFQQYLIFRFVKKTILIFIMCTISFSMVIGQNQKTPSWISGTWENSLISDLEYSVAWTFEHDSIFFEEESPKTRKCISIDFQGFKQTQFSEDSLYRVTFSKYTDKIVYEFKLVKDDLSRVTGEPFLTFSLTINGIKKVEHSKSANLMFLKKELIPVMLTPM